MDVESKPSSWLMMSDSKGPNRSCSRRKCVCLSVAAVILFIGLLILILALTVFKVKKPRATFDHVSLRDLDFGLDLPRLRVLLNVSLDLGVSVYNPNRFGFKYTNSTILLRYRGADVGEVPLVAGNIPSRGSRSLNLTLTLQADRLLANSSLFSDVTSGTLPFQTYLRLAGKTRILFVNVHAITYTTCDIDINLSNRTVGNMLCHYKTKL